MHLFYKVCLVLNILRSPIMKLTYSVIDTTYQNIKEVLKANFLMSDRLILKLKKMQNIFLNGKPIYVHHTITTR